MLLLGVLLTMQHGGLETCGAEGSTVSTIEGCACARPCPPEEPFDSLISTQSMTSEATKTATPEIIFFRQNAYFRNELILGRKH